MNVLANGTPNMTVLVQTGSGRITKGTYPSSYGYFISVDTSAGESVTIATAAASPRIDYIVGYIDLSVSGSALTMYVNNTNNVLKFADVQGTPAGSPVVPTVSQIQTAIGSSNPYIILANVAVAASTTAISNTNITDLRKWAGSSTKGTYIPNKFSAYLAADQSLSSSTWTKVTINTENFDTNNDFDSVTNFRFVAPVTGYYQVNAQVGISGAGLTANTGSQGAIYKNGTALIVSGSYSGTGNSATIPKVGITDLLFLNATDYLEIYAIIYEAGRVVAGGRSTYMSAYLTSTM